jgi:hypothetical protein
MPIIPSSEQFIGFSPNVNTTERRSEIINAESFPYTMQDFINTIGAGQGTQGPQGPAGPQGIQGIQGNQGPAGANGAAGIQGAQGIQGAAGSAGAMGVAGPQGIQGLQGFQGAAGAVGPAGLNWQGGWSALGVYVVDDAVGYGGASWFCISNIGPVPTTPDLDPTNWALLASQGAVGQQGAQGPQGLQGIQGPSGAAAAQGIQGVQGLTGPTGATGPQGLTGAQGVAGVNGAQGPIGPTGATGPQGVQGLQGAQGTAGAVGPAGLSWQGAWVSGSSYIVDDAVGYSGASYFCINATSGTTAPNLDPNWALLASQGAAGVNGTAGVAGAVGATGPIGPQGIAGPIGATGPQGSTGATGATGATGPQGVQGVLGPIGPAGLTWVGTWSALGVYLENEAVSFGGASYFCYNPAGVGPSATDPSLDTPNWALLAAVGATGPAGAAGAAGVAGPTGPAGPTGITGPQGPQGVQGIQGIQGLPGQGFASIDSTPLSSVVPFVSYVVDYITIPANTYNSLTKAILDLTGQLSKSTTAQKFTYELWLTDVLQIVDTPFNNSSNPIKIAGARTAAAAQKTIKLDKSFVIDGQEVYYFDIVNTFQSNSDNAILSSSALYDATIFDGVPQLASNTYLSPIDWTLDWYIAGVVITEDITESLKFRWTSLK